MAAQIRHLARTTFAASRQRGGAHDAVRSVRRSGGGLDGRVSSQINQSWPRQRPCRRLSRSPPSERAERASSRLTSRSRSFRPKRAAQRAHLSCQPVERFHRLALPGVGNQESGTRNQESGVRNWPEVKCVVLVHH
jgi:hypothetical protein